MLREFDERDDPKDPEMPSWFRVLLWVAVGFFVMVGMISAFSGNW